jgi:hypothetical protein
VEQPRRLPICSDRAQTLFLRKEDQGARRRGDRRSFTKKSGASSEQSAESRPTTEKREEQVFIAGRTGTLHHSLQPKGGKEGREYGPSEHISSPIGISGDIGKGGAQRGTPGSKMSPII